jgi:hypothetical protein
MAAQINGVARTLQWTDFRARSVAPPAEGEEVTAAFTNAGFRFQRNAQISWIAGSSPERYRIADNFIMNVELIQQSSDPEQVSWVASWVAAQPATERDLLLNHERGHYGLVALLARDCFNELRALTSNQYESVSAAQDAWNDIVDRFQAKIQPIQNTYDSDAQTRHGFNRSIQTIWDGYLSQARSASTPILTVLSNASITV